MADPRSPRFASQGDAAFFGRTAELAIVRGDRGTPVWISGPPGVGKTRLAREALGQGSGLFVDLSGADDEGDVLVAMAAALDVPVAQRTDAAHRSAAIAAAIRRRGPGWLVLDNADRTAAAVESLLGELQVDGTRLLVTSRSAPGGSFTTEMVEVELAPFGLPAHESDEDCEAVRYLRARSESLGAEFALQGSTASIVELARRLEGLPLALDLAAFRADILSADEMLDRLDASSAFLRDPRGFDPRHESLFRALESSWDALHADDQQTLACLSLVEGSFSSALAEALSPAGPRALDAIATLRRRNLIVALDRGFRLLEPVREFAATKLDDRARDAALGRLRNYLAERTPRWLVAAERHTDADLVRELREHRNCVAPALDAGSTALVRAHVFICRLDGSLEKLGELPPGGSDEEGLALRHDIARGYIEAGFYERAARELAAIIETAPTSETGTEATADAAFTALMMDDAERAGELAERARTVARPGSIGECRAELAQAQIAHTLGQREAARAHYERTLMLARRLRDNRSQARALQNLGVLFTDESRFDLGRRYLQQAIEHHERFGDRVREAWAYNSLGVLELRAHRHDDALAALRNARELFEAVGLRTGAASVVANVAMIAADLERYEEACESALDAIALSDFEEDVYIRTMAHLCLATSYWFLDRKADAGRVFDDLETLFERVAHIQLVVSWLGAWAAYLASVGDERAETTFARAERSLSEVGGDPVLELMLAMNRAHTRIAHYRRDAAAGDRTATETLLGILDDLRHWSSAAFDNPETSEPLRYSVRLLRHELPELGRRLHAADLASPASLVVDGETRSFRPPEANWVTLERSPSLWRLFEALVDARLRDPGARLDLDELQELVWPGETLTVESASNRLYVSVSKLRKMGLGALLLKDEAGYSLDPATPVA